MQEQLAAINARLDVTESETARLAAERLSLEGRCFIAHRLMENRHGLLGDACLMLADGHAERVAALQARCTLRLVRDCDGLDLD